MYNSKSPYIPYMRSYEDAKRKYDSTTPIRGNGRNRGLRPLGSRQDPHKRIRLGTFRGKRAIECVLHDTACVVFVEGGPVVLRYGGWLTPTSAEFMDSLIGKVYRYDGLMMYGNGEGEFIVPDEGLELEPYTLIPINPVVVHVHRVNRKAMNAVRKQYAPTLKLVLGVCKLKEFEVEEWHTEARSAVADQCATLLHKPKDARLALDILDSAKSARYEQSTWVISCDEERVRKHFNYLLRLLHWSEVMEKMMLPIGVYKKDTYADEAEAAKGVAAYLEGVPWA